MVEEDGEEGESMSASVAGWLGMSARLGLGRWMGRRVVYLGIRWVTDRQIEGGERGEGALSAWDR